MKTEGRGKILKGLLCWGIFSLACVLSAADDTDIVVTAKSEEPVKFAASELSSYLGRITGQQPKVSENGKGMFYVSLSSDETVPANIREKLKGHGPEAFVIESNDGKLYLVGNSPRAAVYAVYGFLEKYMGCRWFTYNTDEEIVPEKSMAEIKNLIKKGIKDLEEPDFTIRMLSYYSYEIGSTGTPLAYESAKTWPKLIQWMAKLRFNIFEFDISHTITCVRLWEFLKASNLTVEMRRRGIELGVGGHMPNLLFMTAQDFKEHPDWRPFYKGERQDKGQFCTCNSDARTHYIKKIVEFLKDAPELMYFIPYANDTGGWCKCPLCADISIPDRWIDLHNRLAERLKSVVPHVRLIHTAYGSHSALPVHEKTSLMVTYVPWGRNYSIPIENEKKFYNLCIMWRNYSCQNGADMILHEKYMRMERMGFHLLPLPVLSQDMKFLKKEGVAGFEQTTEHCGWWVKSPNSYVLSHLMWNSDENQEELTDDFFKQFYGPYAKEIEDCCKSVESVMDFKYSGNKWSSCRGTITKDSEKSAKLIVAFKAALPFAERAREQLTQSLQRVRKVHSESVNNAAISSRIGRLETVLDYVFQEASAWHELCQGVTAMEQGKEVTDTSFARKQFDLAAEHFQTAVKFDLALTNYSKKVELLDLLWNLAATDSQRAYSSAVIPQFQEIIAKLRNEVSSSQ